MKKSIIFGFTIILLISSIPISSSFESNDNNIIYVDDDGTADYTRIQDAIDNASDGDTVFVYSGIYYETLSLNKAITIKGENKYTTIIDGKYSGNWSNGIKLPHHRFRRLNSQITGFTIQNFGGAIIKYSPVGGYINTNISENIITNNYYGISTSTTIGGVHIGLDITNNIIENNNMGLDLSCAKDVLIKRNHISSNSIVGIDLDGGIFVRIIQNNIFNNTVDALNNIGFLHWWNRNYWGEDEKIIKIIQGKPINIDWHPAREPYDFSGDKKSTIRESSEYNENNPTPQCNTKWFFLCNINTSGFVDNAYEFLQGKLVRIMYFGSSQGDFGKAVVNKIIKRFDSNHVYSVFAYGFKGNTSWNRSIKENNIRIDGFAISVCIKY